MILTLAELRIGGARLALELDGLLEQTASLRGLVADCQKLGQVRLAQAERILESGFNRDIRLESLTDLEPCLMRGSASAWRPDIIKYFPILSRMLPRIARIS